MSKRTHRGAAGMLLVASFLVGPAAAQGKLDNFEDFATITGRCAQSDFDQLKRFQEGFTFTVAAADILANNGISPQTVGSIPPLTGLTCHGKSRNRDLWLVSKPEDPAFCGWVRSETLLKSKSRRSTGSRTIFGGRPQADGVCGDIAPLTIAEYCATMKTIGANVEACEGARVSRSSINAKFLIWNAALTAEERAANPLEVKSYATSEAAGEHASIKVFSILRIFDIARNDKGIYFLVGASHRNMLGWVKADSGTVWYTLLSTFFTPNGEADIRSDEPRVRDAITVASRPENLAAMLKGKAEFARYPVLFDRRIPSSARERNWIPYLEIAFIGRFCAQGVLCAEDATSSRPELPVDVNKSDVMFLIDATKSMRDYFGQVADAVKNVVTEDYVGSPDFQFGVAMYGDYLRRTAMGLNDPIQYKEVIKLRPLEHGEEFAKLKSEPLYIADPVGELEEAPYAALAKTIRETPWRGDIPRFIIHLADHGDRRAPPPELLGLLQRERIFYIPVAVRGDYNEQANSRFISQAQAILDRHRTPKGETIGLPKVQIAYQPRMPGRPSSEYNEIASAVKGGISLGAEIRKSVMEDLLKLPQTRRSGDENLLPPGYARLTKAAMELYGISSTDLGNVAQRTVATKGYVKTAPISAERDTWSYHAAISPGDISQLKSSFEVLCKTVFQTDSADKFVESLEKILSILTGDVFDSKERFLEYFKDRDSIPLSSRTILGAGLLELGRQLGSPSGAPRIKALQKEACRTTVLLQRMDGRQRLSAPFEKRQMDGRLVVGDLEWDERAGIYHYKNAEQHNWIYEDVFKTQTVFVPLDYLPGPGEAIR